MTDKIKGALMGGSGIAILGGIVLLLMQQFGLFKETIQSAAWRVATSYCTSMQLEKRMELRESFSTEKGPVWQINCENLILKGEGEVSSGDL